MNKALILLFLYALVSCAPPKYTYPFSRHRYSAPLGHATQDEVARPETTDALLVYASTESKILALPVVSLPTAVAASSGNVIAPKDLSMKKRNVRQRFKSFNDEVRAQLRNPGSAEPRERKGGGFAVAGFLLSLLFIFFVWGAKDIAGIGIVILLGLVTLFFFLVSLALRQHTKAPGKSQAG